MNEGLSMGYTTYIKPFIRFERGMWSIYKHYMPKGLEYLPIARGNTPKKAYDKFVAYINY